MTFNGANALNNAAGYWRTSTANAAYNVYAMTTHTTGAGINALFTETVTGGQQTVFAETGGNTYSGIYGSYFVYTPFTAAQSGVPTLLSTRYNSNGAGTRTIAFNTKDQAVNPGGTATAFTGSSSNLVLGSYVDQAQWPFTGDIAEIVMYPTDVAGTGTSKQRIESYFALKWGTTLDQTTPTSYLSSTGTLVWDAAANATYKNNIAGLGRDDAAGLNQKQSQSVNPGNQGNFVTMGLSSITGTNTSNAATFRTDKTFEIWGDDGGAANYGTAYTATTNFNIRLTRVWSLQETGTIGSVRLAVPTALLAGGQLVVSTTATLTSPTVFNTTGTQIINGVATSYFDVDFPTSATSYFSFATKVVVPGGVTPANNTVPGTSFAVYTGGGADYTESVASLATWGTGGTINSTPATYGISDHMEDNSGYTGNTLGGYKYPIMGTEFNATLNVPVSDTYTFTFMIIDNEVQLTLDGIIRYTNGSLQTNGIYTIALSAGPHTIRVKYGNYGGAAHLEVRWNGTNAATAGTASANGTGPIPGTAIPGTASTMLDNRWLTTTGSLAQWLRADAGISTTNGAALTAWADQGHQGNDGGAGTNTTYQNDAANVLNFNPVVKFAVGYEAQAATNGFPYLGQARTVFGVAERNGNGSAIQTYGTNTANNLSALSDFNGTQAGMDTGTGIAGTGFGWTAGVAALSSYEVSFATNKINSRTNGGTATSSTTVPQTSIANLTNLARIGSNEAAGTTHTGRIPELITFPWELTQTERFQVDSYLAVKYGITLAAHNYLATNGTTTTYDISTYGNNIAGIGRDDATALLQKQSRSQNTANRGNIVTMGLSSVAPTNALNPGAITADKAFNIWGDDNGSVTTTTTANLPTGTTGSTCAIRLPRQWKVQRTNAGVGAVQVQLDLTGTVITTQIMSDFVLLIDRDGDGNFTTGPITSVPAVSYATNLVTFNNVTWDGDGSGSDVFALVVNNNSVSPPPQLLTNNSTMVAPIATCNSAEGGMQFVNTLSSPTQKFMQIIPNGNAGYNFGSGITALNNSPVINNQVRTNGTTAATALANRMYTASTAGTFTTNGGMLVRLYYDPADLTAAENVLSLSSSVTGTSNSKWFKFEGTATDVMAAQTPNGFNNTSKVTYLTPSATGTENGVSYVEFANITSFSTFGYLAGRSNATPLPVTLTRFTATRQAADGLLQWETASEANSDFFELQASPTGTNWQVLTIQPAQGNSSTAHAYAFVDQHLARYNAALVYYRLRMVDRDATAHYSPVRALAVTPGQWSVNAYPNPFSGRLSLQLNTTQTEPVYVTLYDAIGKVVLRYEQATTQIGNQLLDLRELPALSTGLYVLRVSQGTHTGTVQVTRE